MADKIAPGSIKIESSGKAGWDTHVFCMQKDGEWVKIPTVTALTLGPITPSSGPLTATLQIMGPLVEVVVQPENVQVVQDLQDASGVSFEFCSLAPPPGAMR